MSTIDLSKIYFSPATPITLLKTGSSVPRVTKEENRRIYQDTQLISITQYPTPTPSVKIKWAKYPPTCVYRNSTTIVKVTPLDTFDQAEQCVEMIKSDIIDGVYPAQVNPLPIILNMANSSTPGGGVLKGSYAQEENLFRRSNYHLTLTKAVGYPIRGRAGIYSPSIIVFKDADYNVMSVPFNTAAVAVAAMRNPAKTNEQFVNSKHYQITKEKIETIFQIAVKGGHQYLILGALGCGAFHNPLHDVVKIFNEIISKYKHCFRGIYFAIRSYHDPNYKFFNQHLQQYS